MKNSVIGILLVILAMPLVSFDCLCQDNETVSMAINRIKDHFGVRFVYDSELGKLLDRKCEEASVEGLSLEKALDKVLEGTGVKWEVRNGYVVLTRDTPVRKRYTVCGYVTDEVIGETLIGAGVVVSVTEPAEVASAPVALAKSAASTSSATGRDRSSATKSVSATGRVGNTANTREGHSATGKTGTSTNNFGFYSLTLPEAIMRSYT